MFAEGLRGLTCIKEAQGIFDCVILSYVPEPLSWEGPLGVGELW